MDRERFVALSVLAFALVIGGFVVRGVTRALVDGRTGDVLAAPLIGGGFVLIVGLTCLSALSYLGVGPLASVDND